MQVSSEKMDWSAVASMDSFPSLSRSMMRPTVNTAERRTSSFTDLTNRTFATLEVIKIELGEVLPGSFLGLRRIPSPASPGGECKAGHVGVWVLEKRHNFLHLCRNSPPRQCEKKELLASNASTDVSLLLHPEIGDIIKNVRSISLNYVRITS